jgi:DNA (cytosine-5)-methyltransferase 1
VRLRVEWQTKINRMRKPHYFVPSMKQIEQIKGTNGFNVFSLFSGCGGSCLGFEMAGFKIVGASEFVEEARKTYSLNHLGTPIDGRDIRDLKASDVFEIAGTDQIDVLEGSPPCASFSTAGKRHNGWGEVKAYSDTEQRSDDLFFEFARLVNDIQPKVFVAENVKGLVTGSAKGYFKLILSRLKKCGYQVEARVVDASYLGVPQARQRVIFIGVRNDLNLPPTFPLPLKYRFNIADAMTDDPSLIDSETGKDISFTQYAVYKEWQKLPLGGHSQRLFSLCKPLYNKPCPTLVATGGNIGAGSVTHPQYPRKLNLKELRLLSSFPADFQLTGTYQQRYERIGRAVPPLMMKAIAETIHKEILLKQ